ncbi:MAG TPA: polysialyltransferase family glycosyltransferase [Coriobacteriia bacterium]
MRGNLFVVTRVGQLRNVQTFIKERGATNNHLAVLSTDDNPTLRTGITSNVETGLFEEVIHIVLPLRPVAQSGHKNAVIYGLLEDLLVRMTGDAGVENLYLCNSDNFYVFFQRIPETLGLALTLNLLEEGLGTYANAGRRRYVRDVSVDWNEVKRRGRMARLDGLRHPRAIAALLHTLVSWVLPGGDPIRLAKDAWARSTVTPKYRYGLITHYDNAYVYFPDRIYSDNMRIDNVEKLGFVIVPQTPPEMFDSVEDGAVVFVSQKYLPRRPYVYYSVVLDILTEMRVGTVYFKFHPRENHSATLYEWDQAVREHPDVDVRTTHEISAIPVEELMMSGKVSRVIGLTSTALMYGSAFFPDVDVISIGSRFRDLADSETYDVTKRALSEFSRDLEIFLDVSHIPQF